MAYFKSFSPARCMDVNHNLFFDDKGEYLLVHRLINTKALLECSSDEEALRLLGRGYGRDLIFIWLDFMQGTCSRYHLYLARD